MVEDDAQIRKFLRISFHAHGYIVHEASLGADGLALCVSVNPDLVILDLGLPDMDGQYFIQRLREWSQVPIMVLSARASEKDKIQALDAGANDYITKPFGIGEMMARIRVMLRDKDHAHSTLTIFESQGLYVDLPRREVRVDGVPIHLTRKEYELLRLLIASREQVLTHQKIIQEIWGPAHKDETQYLRVLVSQLRQKLNDDPTRPRFVITIPGVGYRLAVPER